MSSCNPSSIVLGKVVITQDARGRYSLNDLHRAAGGEPRHQPSNFLRSDFATGLVAELTRSSDSMNAPVEAIRGGPGQGTYVCRELVLAYAAWISPAFHLTVFRTFDAYVHGQLVPAVPKSFPEALRLAAELAERAEQQQRQLEAQQPAVDFVGRYVEATNTKSLREVVKILGLKERAFVEQLLADGVMFRQAGRLLPTAEYQHRGYFEVKTGEANGHAYHHARFTPAGVAWAATRYGTPGD